MISVRSLGCLSIVLVAIWPARAAAAEPSAQIAQSLFDDGRRLLEEGRYAEACPKFAESQRLDPGGGTLLNLAHCHEREGRTASAWLEYREALAQAVREQRADRATFARDRIAAIEPSLVRLSVTVPESVAASNVEVTLDRAPLPRAAWSTPLPVDPGEHHVVVTSEKGVWSTAVRAEVPGRVHEVTVAGPVALEDPSEPSARRRTTAFWIALSGATALGMTSAVTGVLALNANAYANDHCSAARDYCWGDAEEAKSRARALAWTSTVTLGGALVTGVVAFLLPKSERPRRISATLVIDDRQALGVVQWSGP